MPGGQIEIYGFEDEHGEPSGFTTMSPSEARDFAQTHGLKWIAYTYEFSDSDLVEDYTELEESESTA